MEDSGRRATANKRLHANQRVSGALGDYMEGPTKRRRRLRLFGTIVSAVGERKYLVRFDDGTEKECPSAILRVEKVVASLPPDMPLPAASNPIEAAELQDAAEEVVDQEEEEALPPAPEVDEAEVAAEEEAEEVEPTDETAAASDPQQSGMIGQVPTEKDASLAPAGKDYATLKKAAWEKVKSLLGKEVVVTSKKHSMTWKVIESIEPEEGKGIPELQEKYQYGLRNFSCSTVKKSEVVRHIFLRLLFKKWNEKVERLNEAVMASKSKCKAFTEKEFLCGLAVIVGAAEFAKRGSDLFSVKDKGDEDGDEEVWASLCQEPHFEQIMPFSRWKDFRRFLPSIFAESDKKDTDPWFKFSGAIEEFNEIRRNELCCSLWVSVDETMSAWKPRKTATGGLPNISFIVRKPEPLGKI